LHSKSCFSNGKTEVEKKPEYKTRIFRKSFIQNITNSANLKSLTILPTSKYFKYANQLLSTKIILDAY
jgi:hypothetical protein